MKRVLVVVLASVLLGLSSPHAQMRVMPLDELDGHVALGLALRHLGNTGIFMMTTAHPDDENNGLLVMLNRGQGYRTALATATRGNGGQNEIGPEIFEALGVLRTEELAALHRFDGAEQYFTRAVDFGYSFSVEETFEKWGRDEIIGDFVRLIRTVRPDVIAGMSPSGTGGGQHHQASALLSREAFKAAADPTKYPEQIREGLRPWQPRKFYYSLGFGGPVPPVTETSATRLTINLAGYDRLLGRTFAEIGTEARSMHKCQGMAQLLSLPGPASTGYELVESMVGGERQREDRSMFDGVDTSIAGLAQFAGARPPRALTDALATIASAVQNAQQRFDREGDEATLPSLLSGLQAVRKLRGGLKAMNLDDAAVAEIDFRLRQKESEFQAAVLLANNVRIEALASDGVVVPGQPVGVSVLIANRGAVEVAVKQVRFRGFAGDASCTLTAVTGEQGGRGVRPAATAPASPISAVRTDQVARCEPTLQVPADARISEPYWHRAGDAGRYTFDADAPFGLPYRPTPFYVQVTLALGGGGEEVIEGLPVQYRYEGNIFSGEKRSDLLVVPPYSARISPEVAIIPASAISGAAPQGRRVTQAAGAPVRPTAAERPAAAARPQPAEREVRVTVVNGAREAAEVPVALELPAGWSATPATQMVAFTREDEAQTVRFQIRPAARTASGEYRIAALVGSGREPARGYQVIEYPHIRRQHIFHTATTTLKVIDVKAPPNLTVGYIMGVGDEVPPAIEQLGVKVEQLDADDLAWGDLSRFSTIVTGVRAYERRADLRANNSRLLDYVRAGGNMVVQYNKFEFNQAQFGPYPAKVTSGRVTDENAPVTLLAAGDPLLSVPNAIGEAAWKNWVQERGLYFLGEQDSRYRDLISLADPFPYNAGEKRGALVTTQYGKGRWVYVGLGLWRELPAGVDGAYQLLSNLLTPAR